jgi:hypothetical protein
MPCGITTLWRDVITTGVGGNSQRNHNSTKVILDGSNAGMIQYSLIRYSFHSVGGSDTGDCWMVTMDGTIWGLRLDNIEPIMSKLKLGSWFNIFKCSRAYIFASTLTLLLPTQEVPGLDPGTNFKGKNFSVPHKLFEKSILCHHIMNSSYPRISLNLETEYLPPAFLDNNKRIQELERHLSDMLDTQTTCRQSRWHVCEDLQMKKREHNNNTVRPMIWHNKRNRLSIQQGFDKSCTIKSWISELYCRPSWVEKIL